MTKEPPPASRRRRRRRVLLIRTLKTALVPALLISIYLKLAGSFNTVGRGLFTSSINFNNVSAAVSNRISPAAESAALVSQGAVPVKRYHELQNQISRAAAQTRHSSETAYNRATVVRNATRWFKPKKICRESCCAETFAISLGQDERQIINTLGGLDLADVLLRHYTSPSHLKVHARVLDERILPCLQPGTIIHLDNHGKILQYFFRRIRPNITVPFVLLTTESDADSPFMFGERIEEDNLLLKWYGMNPDVSVGEPHARPKFVPFPLGLSKFYPQDRYLSQYLALTNYTNPFTDKSRWSSRVNANLNTDDLFVKFGHNVQSERTRGIIVDALCKGNAGQNITTIKSKDGISCSTEIVDPSELYAAASRYLFGVSPPGAGYDCYRTYELLLLGVIPVIAYRPMSAELFKDLPVVQMRNMFETGIGADRAKQNFVDAIRDYIDSDAFRNGTFAGWERLFLKYWRRRILKDAAGRDGDIVMDEEGREYYQAWRYTPFPANEEAVECSKEGNCET